MEEVYIYNPDNEDYTIAFDHMGQGVTHYTIKSLETKKFPIQVAEHIKHNLADKIWEKRKLTNYPVTIKLIHEEIEVDIEKEKLKLQEQKQEAVNE